MPLSEEEKLNQIASQPIQIQRLMAQEIFNKSLYQTARVLCQFKDVNLKTHGPMIRALESDTERKLLCVPRGTLKSSLGTVAYPILLLNRNPNLRILLDSEIYGNSCNFVREIKNILESDLLTSIYGTYQSSVWNSDEIIINQRTKILKEPSITAGGIAAGKTGQHYDVIIGDDYNSPVNSMSAEQRKKVIDHYQYNLSILEPNGIYVIIGTRYAQDDLIGWIMRNELGLKDSSSRESLKELREEDRVFYKG